MTAARRTNSYTISASPIEGEGLMTSLWGGGADPMIHVGTGEGQRYAMRPSSTRRQPLSLRSHQRPGHPSIAHGGVIKNRRHHDRCLFEVFLLDTLEGVHVRVMRPHVVSGEVVDRLKAR